MTIRPFIQSISQQTTLESWREILVDNNHPSLCAFAYVTDSGAAQVETYLHNHFEGRRCRWVFGFDYGRSHPTAIRKLAEIGNSEIRIHDGEYVAQSQGFTPRTSYHLKTALTQLDTGYPCKQIIGSGNLSALGLVSGVEAGCLIDYSDVERAYGEGMIAGMERVWENATPLENIIDDYQQRYREITLPRVNALDGANQNVLRTFWIDVGYVTKNRGVGRPGNQFDLPRGAHVYLGLEEVLNPALNSTLGELKIRTLTGDIVERRLRYGNNAMEKLTLPLPEQYGYQCYDGKILTFRTEGDEVLLETFEHDDFFKAYGTHISSCVEMQSGRRYGTISI